MSIPDVQRDPITTDLSAFAALIAKHPERALARLDALGRACREHGRLCELWPLLQQLPQDDERVLYWQLSAAARMGRGRELCERIEVYLEQHEAPELRALYAGTLCPPEEALAHAERAYRSRITPLTLYQYGRLLSDMARGAEILRRSVRLAERKGAVFEEVRAAGALCSTLIRLGRYQEASVWGAWAVERYDQANFRDEARRLTLINDLAYASLLSGKPLSLQALLAEYEKLDGVLPALAQLYRSTLGDYLVSRQRYAEAIGYYRHNYEHATRAELGQAALDMVRALVGAGEFEAALTVSQRAYFLSRDEPWIIKRTAMLAYGIALSINNPPRSPPVLDRAVHAYSASLSAHRLAQASLYLAHVRLVMGDPAGARLALAQGSIGLRELSSSGFTLLFGVPEEHHHVWALCCNLDDGLALNFLGDDSAWLHHRPLRLSRREQEIVALLVLHPKGLTLDQLSTLLGDRLSLGNLKTTLSRLRRRVPLTPPPYRLAVSVTADFDLLNELLAKGDTCGAVGLYHGPLLPLSDAPGIREAREVMEEALRQQVLALGELSLLITLAERLGVDPDLWEAALAQLPPQDHRAPWVRARLARILSGGCD